MTAVSLAEPELLRGCHRAAREEGIAPALAVLGSRGSLSGYDGYAAVPAENSSEGPVLREVKPPGGGVKILCGQPVSEPDGTVALGAVWLRLGASQGLLDACLAYLASRGSGDSTLLRQQLVQGAVAEALTGQLEVRAQLVACGAEAPPGAVLAHLHEKISEVDRELLRLLGASGFLSDGPGAAAEASAAVAAVYCPPAGVGEQA